MKNIREALTTHLFNFIASRPGAEVSVVADLNIDGERALDGRKHNWKVESQEGFTEVIHKTMIGYTGGFLKDHELSLTAEASARVPILGKVRREIKLGTAALDNGNQYRKLRERALARLPKSGRAAT